jgi:hypothetical protein
MDWSADRLRGNEGFNQSFSACRGAGSPERRLDMVAAIIYIT